MLKSLIKREWLIQMQALAVTAPQGCFVEVGVYQGGSAQYLYEICERQGRTLHLFDTFEGIPCKSNVDRHEVGDFGDVDLDAIRKAMPNAILHVGYFPQTLGSDVKDIAFIHADVDQYESQKAINKFLWPRVVPGGVMLLDDYFLLQGIRQAVDEDFLRQLSGVQQNRRPYIVKI